MRESEPRYDDEVEITDLDLHSAGEHGPARLPPAARFRPPLRVWARQRRRPLTAVSAALIVLVLLLILFSSTSVRSLVAHRIPTPAPPTPTLFPGLDLFYVDATPPWGHLWVDGRAIAQLPTPGVQNPLRLSRGRHVFTWRAAPFRDLQCTISVPHNYDTDTCVANAQTYVFGVYSSLVLLTDTLQALPDDQQIALIEATQQALDVQQSSDIVRPGERYVLAREGTACQQASNGPACYAVAKQPLRATLRFQLDANPTSTEGCVGPEPGCTYQHQDCHFFCPGAAEQIPQEWSVFVPVQSLWTFTTMDGRILEQDVSDNILWDYASGQPEDDSLMELHITWDTGGWHITIPTGAVIQQAGFLNPTCAAANTGTQMFADPPPADAAGNAVYLQWQFVSGANPAAGCVGVGTPNSPSEFTDLTPTVFPVPYCLHRFGVMLAANPAAHRYWPQLPLADAHEQQLAQQLATSAGKA